MRTHHAVPRAPTFVALTTIALAAACATMPSELPDICATPDIPARVSVQVPEVLIRVGSTVQASATPVDAKGDWLLCAPDVQFVSTDPLVATVSSTGLVTGISAGSVYIRASSGRARDSVAIKVVATTLASVVIKSVPPSLMLRQTVRLGLEARDTEGNVITPKSVTWRSDDVTVATITNTGMVVAVAEGSATVTLEAEGVTAVARIQVSDQAPTRLFRQIATASEHTCAIVGGGGIPEGTAYCWGDGTLGQLGVGKVGFAAAPIRVAGEHSFTYIAAAAGSSCGVTTSGETYCWGVNGFGQLGDGTQENRIVPVRVVTTLAFRAVAIGYEMTCGLTADSSAYCWGRIGNATVAPPTLVSGGIKFVDLTGGGSFVCGRTYTGRAYCWGTSDTWFGSSPTEPRGDLRFSQISAGVYHVCGVSVTDGLGYCWGRMDGRPLGTTVSAGIHDTPIAIPGGLRFRSVSAGGGFTCGVTENGSYCLGIMGLSNSTDSYGAVRAEPRERFATLATGQFHACAIDTRGGGWCWGGNSAGQVGAGERLAMATDAYQLLIR